MRFVARRLLLFVAALTGLSILVFLALRVLPGDVAAVMAGTNATAARIAALRMEMGLDRPLPMQYADWLTGLLHGDLGVSAISGKSVALQVGVRSAVTFPLIVFSLAIALLIGLPLGCAAVITRNRRWRGLLHVIAIIGGAVPALWSGLLLILLFSRGSGLLGLFPSQGFPNDGWASPRRALASLVLPALATGITAGAGIMRYTRAALGDAAQSQAVSMAMACGMTRKQALLRVGLRLSLPQLVSVIGLTFAQMVTGVMVIENLFALPGLGAMLVTDVGNRDLDRGAERTVPADRVLPAAGAGGRYGASCARPKTEKRFHRLAGGAVMSTARVVMRSIWRKASGKYALTVLGLWVLVSLVSLVWTPHTLLETDGFHAWASPSAAHPLGTDGVGADVLSWLMAGFAHESCDRIADRCRVRHIRPGIGGRHGVAQHRAAIHVGGGGRCADLYTDRADRIDAVRAVRRLGGGDCGRMRIRLRTESGAYRKTCGRTRRAFAVC